MLLTKIDLIRRPKLRRPGWHFGVAVQCFCGGVVVYDVTHEHGLRVCSLRGFLKGRRGEVVETLRPQAISLVLASGLSGFCSGQESTSTT